MGTVIGLGVFSLINVHWEILFEDTFDAGALTQKSLGGPLFSVWDTQTIAISMAVYP